MSCETFNLKSLEDCLKNVPEADLRDLKAAIYGRPDELVLWNERTTSFILMNMFFPATN